MGDYWLRHITPDLTLEFAKFVDKGVINLFQRCLGINIDSWSDFAKERMRLPIKITGTMKAGGAIILSDGSMTCAYAVVACNFMGDCCSLSDYKSIGYCTLTVLWGSCYPSGSGYPCQMSATSTCPLLLLWWLDRFECLELFSCLCWLWSTDWMNGMKQLIVNMHAWGPRTLMDRAIDSLSTSVNIILLSPRKSLLWFFFMKMYLLWHRPR